jgi:nicotinate-nucleotide--dimethylbenzimidazole phosphoribosyltransferase
VSDLDLDALVARIERPDDVVTRDARESLDRLVLPTGGLGRLGDLAVWLAGVQGRTPPRPLVAVRLLVLVADHGIAASGVSAWPSDATATLAARIVAGDAPVNVAARLAGVPLRVHEVAPSEVAPSEVAPSEVAPSEDDSDARSDEAPTGDHRRRRASGRIDVEDAMSVDQAASAISAGIAIADEEIDSGADLLVLADVGVGSTTAAATLVGLLTGTDASGVVGRGSGIDDATWMRKCAAIRDAMRRARPVLGDQVALLATAGGADLAVATGLLLGAAARRTPVLLDGVVSAAAALVAQRVAFRSVDWWLAAHRTGDPAHELALDRLSLEPLLDLGIHVGEGVGAMAAVPLLQTASALLAEAAPWAPTAEPQPAP